jgi:hypothetical protein
VTQLVPVPAHDVPLIWPAAVAELRKAIRFADGVMTEATVYEALLSRDMQLWTAWDDDGLEAAAVTQIVCYPGKKVAAIPLIGGRRRNDWLCFQPVFEAWARQNGCDALEGYARPGWLRVLSDDWRHCWTVIRKDLSHAA